MMHMTEKIAKEESTYERALLTAAKAVTGDRAAKVVLITGGSCAGKTTTTKKLSQYIRDAGRRCHTVSIDDFYKNPDDVPLDENGRRDLEGIESIDLAYLHECLEQLAAGREARIPRFDFMLKKRADDYTPITLGDGDVAVIEGLHALNPIVYDRFVDERSLYRIYLYAHSVRVSEPRLLRRLVRDYHYRDASAEVTFSMWESVKRGEVENLSLIHISEPTRP